MSNRLSLTMKKMMAVASVVLPWSLIPAAWGMNIRVPGNSGDDGLVAFIGLVSTMTAMSLLLYYLGRRYDWF
jgi:Mg2+ and Co2+ transporter CorA